MIDQVKYVYFIGIGGIGMSALARYFKHRDCDVFGYDRTETALTRTLVDEGIPVTYVDGFGQVPSVLQVPSANNLIIYTPAVRTDLELVSGFRKAGHTLYKRSEVLGMISEGNFTIAIAGTHGKTTTSCLVAHLLTDSGYGCSAFLGGISVNYNTNTLFGPNKTIVVEADEYDRSFLTLHPDIAILISADADHLDIYGHHAQMTESFELFMGQVHAGGKKIVREGLSFAADVYYSAEDKSIKSNLSTAGDIPRVFARNIRIEEGSYYFDYVAPDAAMGDLRLGIPGRHNVENAVAAITVARSLGIGDAKIKASLANFAGVKRRFEYIVREEQRVYIDDYAHHPTELKAFLGAVRELYPEQQLTVVFQPHLFTRTRDFMDGFVEALSQADTLLLMEIYPAREQPIEGISSTALLAQIDLADKHLLSESGVIDYVLENNPGLLVTVGAGNIDRLVEPLKKIMTDG